MKKMCTSSKSILGIIRHSICFIQNDKLKTRLENGSGTSKA